MLAPELFISCVSPLVWDDVIRSEDNRAHLPVSVSSHAHRSSEWHTLRRDASWVRQALLMSFIYFSPRLKVWQSCAPLVVSPRLFFVDFLHLLFKYMKNRAGSGRCSTSGSYTAASGRATWATTDMRTSHPAAHKRWTPIKTASVDVSDVSFEQRYFLWCFCWWWSLHSACRLWMPPSPSAGSVRYSGCHSTTCWSGTGLGWKSPPGCLDAPLARLHVQANIETVQSMFTAVRRRSLIMTAATSGGLHYLWR